MARIDKINEEVKRELSMVLRELKDSRIPMMTSVVAVSVTNDLRYAKVYVAVMGDDKTMQRALQGLKSAAGFVHGEMRKRVQMRKTPEFIFELDNSIEHGAYINELLKKSQKGEQND